MHKASAVMLLIQLRALILLCLCLAVCVLSHQLHFLHIPKTGGEYIEALFGLHKNHDMMTRQQAAALQSGQLVFTVLREPLSRAVSWYNFCRSGYHGDVAKLPRPHHECQLARQLDLNSFLLLVFVATPYTEERHVMRNSYDDYLCHDNKPVFHYALHFESYEQDLRHLLNSVNASSMDPLPTVINPSKHLQSVDDVHPEVQKLFRLSRSSDYSMYEQNHRFRVATVCPEKHPFMLRYSSHSGYQTIRC